MPVALTRSSGVKQRGAYFVYVTLLYPPRDKVNAAYYLSKASHFSSNIQSTTFRIWRASSSKISSKSPSDFVSKVLLNFLSISLIQILEDSANHLKNKRRRIHLKKNPKEVRVRVANLKPASKRRLYFVYYQALAG